MVRIYNKVLLGRKYLFSTPTKSLEFLNGVCLSFFGAVFSFNGAALGTYKFYVNFNYIGPIWVWWFVTIIGIMQINAMRKDTLESNVMSAILMKVSALIWFMAAVMFGSDYPPLSTGFFTYLSFSLVNVLGGFQLSAQNTYELLIREEFRDD